MRFFVLLALAAVVSISGHNNCAAQDTTFFVPAIIPLDSSSFRNISPYDQARLKSLFADKRVVMLGEATHGDGSAQELKAELVKFLHEACGFNLLAFESGFYDLHKAAGEIASGRPFREAIEKSIFPIWVNSRQCQSLWSYLEQNRSSLSLAGFDPQLSGQYSKDMVDDLEAFWEQLAPDADPDFDFLEETVVYMAGNLSFPAGQSYTRFEGEINKILPVLTKATSKNKAAAWWKQAVLNLRALADDYYHNDPSAKGEQIFKASDSNPRDRQMAQNLLFILQQDPSARVICWGATTHFIRDPRALQNKELQQYTSMGSLLKKQLGERVYIVGTTAGSGQYGIFGKNLASVQPAKNSLEEALAAGKIPTSFISLKGLQGPQTYIAEIVEHKPLAGNWQQVVDAVLFVPRLSASAFYEAGTQSVSVTPPPADTGNHQVTIREAGNKLVCKVISHASLQPIPFATVGSKGGGANNLVLVSNNNGLFELPRTSLPDTLEVSCIGYETRQVDLRNSPGGADTLLLQLFARTVTLPEVVVRSFNNDPVGIMKKVIDRRGNNLPAADFTINVYAHESLKESEDTIRDMEYITDVYAKNGYGKDHAVQAGLSELKWNVNKADSLALKNGRIPNMANTTSVKPFSRLDYLYELPLFNDKKKLKHYKLRFDSMTTFNDHNVFVISFEAARKSDRYTFHFFASRFYGTIFVNSSDYAVLKYRICVDSDTAKENIAARRYFNKPVWGSDKSFWSMLTFYETFDHTAIYNKIDSVYLPVYISVIHKRDGYMQLSGKNAPYKGFAEFFMYNHKPGAALPATWETSFPRFSKPYNAAFWNSLVKPVNNAY